MSDYCGWCGKRLTVIERNHQETLEKAEGTQTKTLNSPLCAPCRKRAVEEGYVPKKGGST